MKKIIYIITALLLFLCQEINAQGAIPTHDRDPKFPKIETPNAASFNKFIDNPISLYNGTPDVSIPLFNLKDGVINIPISLRYNTSGIKVDEEASWVGLGWNLNVGGVITKSTIGKADESSNTIDYLNFLGYLNLCGRNFVESYCTPLFTEVMYNTLYDKMLSSTRISYVMPQLNPDVYYYSYPGGAGRFIIDYRDNKIYLLDRENGIKIIGDVNAVGGSNYGGFDIITEEGIEHTFIRRTSIFDPSKPFGTTSINYTLECSIYPNGQRVDYTYTTIPYRTLTSPSESYQKLTERNVSPNGYTLGEPNHSEGSSSFLEGTEFILTGIQTTNYQVRFTTSGRTDLENAQKLDKITIEPRVKNTDSEIKQLVFKYDYFIGKTVGKSYKTSSQYTLNRLKLNSINYLDKTNAKTDNRYDFYYEGETLPQKGSYAVDYWGYYNGQANTTLLPNLEYLYYGLKSEKDYKEIVKMNGHMGIYRANRASEEKYTKAGILKGIKYPTGGYREFEYELNTFVDYFIPTVSEITNDIFYANKINDQNAPINDKRTCSFILEGNTEVSIDLTVAKGLNTWYDMQKHSLKIYKYNRANLELVSFMDAAELCFSNHINSVSVGIVNKKFTVSLGIGQYLVEIDLDNALGDQSDFNDKHGEVRASISFPKAFNIKESKGCGLRIKNIMSYNDIDKKERLLSTNYTYVKEGTTSSGILHEKPIFHQRDSSYYSLVDNTKPSWPTPNTMVLLLEHFTIGSSNYMSNPYRSVSSVGYSSVKETQTGVKSQGYTIHSFINKEPLVSENSVRLDDPLNGRLNDLKAYNKDNQLIKQEKYYYRSTPFHNYYGINIIYRVNMYPELFKTGVFTMNSFSQGWYSPILYEIKAHALNSVDIYLDKKESTIDGITTTETYKYNNVTHQLKEHATTLDSNGSTLKKTYSYANDFISISTYNRMAAKNGLSDIVGEKVFNNNVFIGGSLNTYSEIMRLKGRYFLETDIDMGNILDKDNSGLSTDLNLLSNAVYKEYDSYYNPIYIIHNGVSDLVYLWSYKGQYPIAKIENATSSQVTAAVKTVFGVASINDLSQLDNPSTDKIELLRTNSNLANALVTTFTYTPLVGIRTATDTKGITTFYDYDEFGRLKEVYIKENGQKRIIDSYMYNLSN